MRRRFVAGATISLIVLAACGDGGSILNAGLDSPPSTVAPASTQPGQTTVPPTTTTTPLSSLPACPVEALAAAAGPVELTFWHGMNGDLEKQLVTLTDEYNASQPKVHVTLQNQGGYEQTISKYLQSGQDALPDLAQMPEYMVQAMRDTHSNVPVEACVKADGYDVTSFLPRAISQYTTESVLWSMPFNVSDPVLFYNKKMFAAAGLDPEKPPASLEELRADSQAIVSSGAASYGIALDSGSDSGGGWFLEQWFSKARALYSDNDNGRTAPSTKVLFDSPAGSDMLTYLQKMIADGLAVNVGDNSSGQDNFLKLADKSKPAAMTIGTSAALGQVLSVVKGGLFPGISVEDIGIGPMPGPNGAPGALVGGASLWIVDGKRPEVTAATWDYIKFLVTAQHQSEWAAATGYVPVRQDALTLPPIATTYQQDPRFQVAYDQLLQAVDAPSSVGPVLGPMREVRAVAAQMIAEVFNGADVAASLAAGAQQADALIAGYRAQNG